MLQAALKASQPLIWPFSGSSDNRVLLVQSYVAHKQRAPPPIHFRHAAGAFWGKCPLCQNPTGANGYVNSSLYLVEAKMYSRLQIRRFMVTTIALMTTVAPRSTGKFPASVARLITAPSPVIENV